ncbi:TetR/AcrR family transcriptional regulator [Flavisphingomonas formosensis]|uniref:TetR/AcrR family transcriptional regulator n=1 Tax=Flavisphingomonas formosensis TaxID=861534 RepID=UPI0012F8A6DD|nr:TetR/AcrR family transcriptional regulator [Sphingomonas formosensis]
MNGIKKRRAEARKVSNDRYVKRRQEVIAAAAKVFKENGLAATSIDDIAKATGLNRASLYYYVGDKHELFGEVIIDVVKHNVEMAEKIRDSEGEAEEKIHQLFGSLLRSYNDYYPHVHVFMQEDFSQISHNKASDWLDLQRRFDRALIAIIEEGMQRGSLRSDLPVRLVAFGLIGMVNWTHRWFHPDGPVSCEDVAQVFAKLAIEGMRKAG